MFFLSTFKAYIKITKLPLTAPYSLLDPLKYLFVSLQVFQELLSTFMLSDSSLVLFILSTGEKAGEGLSKYK
jgi:hypothetical protein